MCFKSQLHHSLVSKRPKENTTNKGRALNLREICSRHLCFCDDDNSGCVSTFQYIKYKMRFVISSCDELIKFISCRNKDVQNKP